MLIYVECNMDVMDKEDLYTRRAAWLICLVFTWNFKLLALQRHDREVKMEAARVPVSPA